MYLFCVVILANTTVEADNGASDVTAKRVSRFGLVKNDDGKRTTSLSG